MPSPHTLGSIHQLPELSFAFMSRQHALQRARPQGRDIATYIHLSGKCHCPSSPQPGPPSLGRHLPSLPFPTTALLFETATERLLAALLYTHHHGNLIPYTTV